MTTREDDVSRIEDINMRSSGVNPYRSRSDTVITTGGTREERSWRAMCPR